MRLNQSTSSQLTGKNLKIAIILSRFNDELGLELFQNTKETLKKYEVKEKNIDVIRVPGALEIPFAVKKLLMKKKYHAIIALGLVIKGETPHFEYVSQECYRGLMNLNLEGKIPVIFGVLTVNNEKQARDRVSSKKLNKGREYAMSAIEMAQLLK